MQKEKWTDHELYAFLSGAPREAMVDDDEAAGNVVAVELHFLIHTLLVRYGGHKCWALVAEKEEEK